MFLFVKGSFTLTLHIKNDCKGLQLSLSFNLIQSGPLNRLRLIIT